MKERLQFFENTDTTILDVTREMTRVVQSGNPVLARQFVESEEYRAFQQKILQMPEHIVTTYVYNCVAAYIIATGKVRSYTLVSEPLEKVLNTTYNSPEDYMQAMRDVIILFTEIVEKDQVGDVGSIYVKKACHYISDHLFGRIDVNEVSAYAGCSPSYLRHSFRKELDQTMLQYIHGEKLKAAVEMLRGGGMSLAEVSAQLGFCSESHFINVFKKHYGMTPGKYRAEML